MKRYAHTLVGWDNWRLMPDDDGEYVRFQEAMQNICVERENYRQIMDQFMALKSQVVNLESRIALIDKRLEDECPFDWGNHRIVITYLSPINNDT